MYKGHQNKLEQAKSDESKEDLRGEYLRHPAVKVMRSMLSGLKLVGISSIAGESRWPTLPGTGKLTIAFEGEKHEVLYTYQHVLLAELVEPIRAEALQIATSIRPPPSPYSS